MIRAVNHKKAYKYVSWTERHLPKKDHTVFLIQQLSAPSMKDVDNESLHVPSAGDDAGATKVTTGTQKLIIWKYGLKGFENLVDEDGTEVIFKNGTEEELEDSISRIPYDIREELFNELRRNDGNKSLKDEYESNRFKFTKGVVIEP